MLNRVKAWLTDRAARGDAESALSSDRIAAAALLVEAAFMDGDFGASERETIARLLSQRFDLSDEETGTLIEAASERQASANEIFKFAYEVRMSSSEEECADLMRMLWATVLADGIVHDYEASLMRRIAGLLHVPDRLAGEARKRAEAERKPSDG